MSAEAQAALIRPPRASLGAVLATSTVVATIDLRTVGQAVATNTPGASSPGLPGHYVTVTAVNADCYVAFGPTAASVNAIVPLTAGTNLASFGEPVFAGTSRDFWLANDNSNPGSTTAGVDSFMGYRTQAGTGFVIVRQSSQ